MLLTLLQSYLSKNKFTLVKLLLSILTCWLVHYNYLDFIVEWLNTAELNHQNQSYLSIIRSTAIDDLLHISELLAAVEIARSSEVGISFFATFNVDVGNLLHTFSGLLERGVEVTLVSLSSIEILILLDDFSNWVSPYLFEIFILSIIVYYVLTLLLLPEKVCNEISRFCKLILCLFLLAFVAIPYSIHISSFVTKELTQVERLESSNSLMRMHDELLQIKSHGDLKKHAKASLHHLKKMSRSHVNQKVNNVSQHIITTTAINIFNLLLMPLMLVLLFYWLIIRIISMVETMWLDSKYRLNENNLH